MVLAIEFDFENKHEGQLPWEQVCESCRKQHYCWIDFDESEADKTRQLMLELGLLPETIEAIFAADARTPFNIHSKCLQFILTEARFDNGNFHTIPVKVVLGENFMITIHRGEIVFLQHVLQTYSEGFHTAALSPGFLLFELADHVTHVYRNTLSYFAERVDEVEVQLVRENRRSDIHQGLGTDPVAVGVSQDHRVGAGDYTRTGYAPFAFRARDDSAIPGKKGSPAGTAQQ